MKGRFSRIFELFNQRNTEYYQQAFERLEKENKTTFNFAAAFYPTTWLVFRKMYGWAILFILISAGIQTSLGALYPGPKATAVISSVLWLVMIIGFGFWGNSLYYREVKSRVSKGYNSMEGYSSIDPVWGIIVIGLVVPLLVGIATGILVSKNIASKNVIVWIVALIQMFFMAIPWTINYKKFHSQESAEPAEVTEESVNAYLEKADPKHLTGPMCTMIFTYLLSFLFILSMVSVLAVAGMKATGEKIKSQMDKIGEEVDKTPLTDAVNGLTDHKTLKQSVKLSDYLNKEVSEKQDFSQIPEKNVNQKSSQEKTAEIEEERAVN